MSSVAETEAVGTLTFHQALLQAEAQARSTLDVALHERLSAAVALVTDGRVFQTADGDWQVDSSSTAGLTYSVNGVCSCDDHHFNKPPQGLCKHRLAMYLSQRVCTLMQAPAAPVVPVEPWPDNDPEPVPTPAEDPPCATAAECQASSAPLPEAPASVNVRLTIAGRDVQWTLRDADEDRLATRLEALLARYPQTQPQGTNQLSPQQHNAAAMHRPVAGFCAVHNVQMRWNEGKEGKRGWYSHRTDDGWCKGR